MLFVAASTVLVGPAPPVASRLCTADPVQAKAVAGLANFARWLRRHDASGFIGEVGWPSTRDGAQWNALAETWYTAADRIGLPVTAWAAGPWPADYPMAVYRPGAGPSTAQSDADTPGS